MVARATMRRSRLAGLRRRLAGLRRSSPPQAGGSEAKQEHDEAAVDREAERGWSAEE